MKIGISPRRDCRSRWQSRITAAVVETLESRKLLSSVSFNAVTSYTLSNPTVGSGSGGPTVFGDFNHDGHVDAAAVVNDTLNIAYGNTDGTFTVPKSTPIASDVSSTFVAKAHVSGDGPDIVIDDQADETQSASGTSPSGSVFSDYVQLFKNAGAADDGTENFTPEVVAFSAGAPYSQLATSVVAGNFGGDGRADDLIVSENSTGSGVFDSIHVT